jgi:hypothetical protein
MPDIGWDLALWAFIVGFFSGLGWTIAAWLWAVLVNMATRNA